MAILRFSTYNVQMSSACLHATFTKTKTKIQLILMGCGSFSHSFTCVNVLITQISFTLHTCLCSFNRILLISSSLPLPTIPQRVVTPLTGLWGLIVVCRGSGWMWDSMVHTGGGGCSTGDLTATFYVSA